MLLQEPSFFVNDTVARAVLRSELSDVFTEVAEIDLAPSRRLRPTSSVCIKAPDNVEAIISVIFVLLSKKVPLYIFVMYFKNNSTVETNFLLILPDRMSSTYNTTLTLTHDEHATHITQSSCVITYSILKSQIYTPPTLRSNLLNRTAAAAAYWAPPQGATGC
jgi:hypothetical protein